MIDKRKSSLGVRDNNKSKITSLSRIRSDHSLPIETPQSEPSVNHIINESCAEGDLRDYLGNREEISKKIKGMLKYTYYQNKLLPIEGNKSKNRHISNESSTTTKFVQFNHGDFIDTCTEEDVEIPKIQATPTKDQIILASSNEVVISRKESNTNNTISEKNQMVPRIPSHLRMINNSSEENTGLRYANNKSIKGVNIGINTEDNYTSTFPSIVNRNASEDINKTK